MKEMKRSYFRNRKAEKLSVYQQDEIWAKRERKEMLEKILGSILHWTIIIAVSIITSLTTHFAIFALKHFLGIGI